MSHFGCIFIEITHKHKMLPFKGVNMEALFPIGDFLDEYCI